MTDTMTPQQRHYCMSRIRSKDTTPLKDLFNKTIFKNDKERFGFNEPTLFDNFD